MPARGGPPAWRAVRWRAVRGAPPAPCGLRQGTSRGAATPLEPPSRAPAAAAGMWVGAAGRGRVVAMMMFMMTAAARLEEAQHLRPCTFLTTESSSSRPPVRPQRCARRVGVGPCLLGVRQRRCMPAGPHFPEVRPAGEWGSGRLRGSSYFSVFHPPPRKSASSAAFARRHGCGAPRPRAHARQQEPRRRWGGGGRSLPAWAQGRSRGACPHGVHRRMRNFCIAASARLPQVHSRLLPARDVGARPRVERAGGARARDAPGGRSCAAAGGWVAGWLARGLGAGGVLPRACDARAGVWAS